MKFRSAFHPFQLAFVMRSLLNGTVLLLLSGTTIAAPVIYTNEALYLADLAALPGSTIHESFEDDLAWETSRNSISNPGSTAEVTSQGIVWTSNHPSPPNNIATGTVGGSAPDGSFAIYALPHGLTTDSGLYCDSAEDPDIPLECYQNDGLKVESASGETLYAFGGRIDTATGGKITFLLDAVDINGNNTDNINNWQREGESADNWEFVGVIDTAGFFSAEIRELRGKDYQQVLLFADDFTIKALATVRLEGDYNNEGTVNLADYTVWRANLGAPAGTLANDPNPGAIGASQYATWKANFGRNASASLLTLDGAAVPEPKTMLLLALVLGSHLLKALDHLPRTTPTSDAVGAD